MNLIGFAGRKRAGKDTAADALTGWGRTAFADSLRTALLRLDPWVCADPHIGTRPMRLSDLLREGGGWEPVKSGPYAADLRRLMQRFGTDCCRDTFGADCWSRLTAERLDAATGPMAITDVRFVEEADLIWSRGGIVVEVVRPSLGEPTDLHPSEQIGFTADAVVVNDGSIDDLHDRVRAVVGQFETCGAGFEDLFGSFCVCGRQPGHRGWHRDADAAVSWAPTGSGRAS